MIASLSDQVTHMSVVSAMSVAIGWCGNSSVHVVAESCSTLGHACLILCNVRCNAPRFGRCSPTVVAHGVARSELFVLWLW